MPHASPIRPLLGIAAVLFAAPLGLAQEFNIDFGSAAGGPPPTYGAASGVAGVWNTVPATVPLAPVALVDTSGAPTSVTLQVRPGLFGYNGVGGRSFDNPNTSGGDEALMDDLLDLGGGVAGSIPSGVAVLISGLGPRTYDIYTYCFAPDNVQLGPGYAWLNFVVLPGATSGMTPVASLDWPPTGHLLRKTFALHTVTVAAGATLLIRIDADTSGATPGSIGSLNGIQIVESTGGAAKSYCTSKPSSLPGCTPTLSAPLVPLYPGLGIAPQPAMAAPVPGGDARGLLLFGTARVTPPLQTVWGELCIVPSARALVSLTGPGGTAGRCDGAYLFDLKQVIDAATPAQAQAGDVVYFQAWYRDPGHAAAGNADLTNAIGDFPVF